MDIEYPDLNETGTRYQHYAELAELFRTGVDILDTMSQNLINDTDRKKRVKLVGAIELIEARMGLLADYDKKTFSLRRTIDLIPSPRPLLTEGTDAIDKASN